MVAVFPTEKETVPFNMVAEAERQGTIIYCIITQESQVKGKLLIGDEDSRLPGLLLKSQVSKALFTGV